MNPEFQALLDAHHRSLTSYAEVGSQIVDARATIARLENRQQVILEDIKEQSNLLKSLEQAQKEAS